MRTLFLVFWVIAALSLEGADLLFSSTMFLIQTPWGLDGFKKSPFQQASLPLFSVSETCAEKATSDASSEIKTGKILLCWLVRKPHNVGEVTQIWDWAPACEEEVSVGCYTQGMVSLGILSGSCKWLALIEVKDGEKAFMSATGEIEASPRHSSLHDVSQWRQIVKMENIISVSIHEAK